MALPKFKKKNIKSTKGLQSSKYDSLSSEFPEEGDTLTFEEDEVSKQTASNIAKRLSGITPYIFHSFYDKAAGTTNVRRRLHGEVPNKEEEEGDDGSDDAKESPPVVESEVTTDSPKTKDDPFGLA